MNFSPKTIRSDLRRYRIRGYKPDEAMRLTAKMRGLTCEQVAELAATRRRAPQVRVRPVKCAEAPPLPIRQIVDDVQLQLDRHTVDEAISLVAIHYHADASVVRAAYERYELLANPKGTPTLEQIAERAAKVREAALAKKLCEA